MTEQLLALDTLNKFESVPHLGLDFGLLFGCIKNVHTSLKYIVIVLPFSTKCISFLRGKRKSLSPMNEIRFQSIERIHTCDYMINIWSQVTLI